MFGWLKEFKDKTYVSNEENSSWSKSGLDEIIGVTLFYPIKDPTIIPSGYTRFYRGLGEYHYSEDYEVLLGQSKPIAVLQRIQFKLDSSKWETLEIDIDGNTRSYISEVKI